MGTSFLLLTSVIACATETPTAPSAVGSTEALITALRQQGATVTLGELLPVSSNPFFSAPARVVFVNSGHVNVFEYDSESVAQRDASRVSPSGCSIGSTMITWISPPHFYRSGPLIVIYAGTAADVLEPLGRVLGEPFARCG